MCVSTLAGNLRNGIKDSSHCVFQRTEQHVVNLLSTVCRGHREHIKGPSCLWYGFSQCSEAFLPTASFRFVQTSHRNQRDLYLKPLMNRTTGPSSCCFPRENQSPADPVLSILPPGSRSFSRQIPPRRKPDARPVGDSSCLSQAAGVGKQKSCTGHPSPSAVLNVKKHVHRAAGKPIQAERGS